MSSLFDEQSTSQKNEKEPSLDWRDPALSTPPLLSKEGDGQESLYHLTGIDQEKRPYQIRGVTKRVIEGSGFLRTLLEEFPSNETPLQLNDGWDPHAVFLTLWLAELTSTNDLKDLRNELKEATPALMFASRLSLPDSNSLETNASRTPIAQLVRFDRKVCEWIDAIAEGEDGRVLYRCFKIAQWLLIEPLTTLLTAKHADMFLGVDLFRLECMLTAMELPPSQGWLRALYCVAIEDLQKQKNGTMRLSFPINLKTASANTTT